MKKILIIDDDEKLGQLLTQYLERYDMQAHVALTPSKGFELLKKLKPDLLILDVMLPEKDGFEICREIRAKSSIFGQLPILMLTAHAEVADRIAGLELGADEAAMHAEVAKDPSIPAVHLIHCAGPRMRHLFEALPEDQRGIWAETSAELAAAPAALVDAGDVVLVKGSKGSKVSLVVDAIRKLGHPDTT